MIQFDELIGGLFVDDRPEGSETGAPPVSRVEAMVAALAADVEMYSAGQARDHHGRFSGPGGGAGGPVDTSKLTGGGRKGPIDDAVAEHNLQSVYDRAGKTTAHDSGMKWYGQAHDDIGSRAQHLGVDPQRFAGMVAATSPHCQWATKDGRLVNIDLAEKATLAARAHPGMSGREVADSLKAPGMLKNSLANAIDIHNGVPAEKVLKGPKTRSFYNNLVWVNGTKDVTVDTHMIRAMSGKHDLPDKDVAKYSGIRYGWSADRIRAVATKNRVSPAQAQAIVWEQWRREA
jgi:hypothetical protein